MTTWYGDSHSRQPDVVDRCRRTTLGLVVRSDANQTRVFSKAKRLSGTPESVCHKKSSTLM